jgi:hypothetical protein
MKGGITSGVVYPLAACELAKAFRFKNIGGTSAGAIAAAATAAAELGRTNLENAQVVASPPPPGGRPPGQERAGERRALANSPDKNPEPPAVGFDLLADLPRFLGAKPPNAPNSNLFYFFKPQPATKPVFDVCVAALGGGWRAIPRVLSAAAKSFSPFLCAGLLPGLAFIGWAVLSTSGPFLAVCVLVGTIMALGLSLLSVALAFLCRCITAIPKNFFGLCSAMSPEPSVSSASDESDKSDGSDAASQSKIKNQKSKTSPTPLTPWLTNYLNRLAGLPTNGPPLTFGDLWGTKDSNAPRRINLEMMTTCLSHGRPYRLPFRNDEFVREDGHFFFRSDEFNVLFPRSVVEWMEKHPRAALMEPSREREAEYLAAGYRPLPEPWDLPIVVAVRMSLSFPILLSAVPLHAIDYGRTDPADRTFERCWFSDGGISSNFPVHFFDSLLPRWPTFAITLADQHPDHTPGMWMPSTNSPGTEHWTRFDHDATAAHKPLPCLTQLCGFLSAILNAMQNWSDNAQTRLPGYRDRIATVGLSADQGGLNLNMPKSRIDTLANYGGDAGVEFVKRFAVPDPGCRLDWSNHRWVRLRSALAALEEDLIKLDTSCAAPLKPDQPYDVWLKTTDNDVIPSYKWEPVTPDHDWTYQRDLAVKTLAALRACAQALQQIPNDPAPLSLGSPRPRPELRIRPRI